MRESDTDNEVAIIPEMKIASGDGVVVGNREFKLALTGVVDYGVVRYHTQYRGRCTYLCLAVTDLEN
jgi:hypothetical protein